MILQCLSAVTNRGIIDNWVLAPNTSVEANCISQRIGQLQLDPFVIQLVNNCGDYGARVHFFPWFKTTDFINTRKLSCSAQFSSKKYSTISVGN
jgi:hypothetical protein